MTITIELTPHVEAQLKRKAARQGQDVTNYLQMLVEADARQQDLNLADFLDAVAGIQRGMADAEAGREISLEEYRAQIAEEGARSQGAV
jgi:predicted transcriptional regulator